MVNRPGSVLKCCRCGSCSTSGGKTNTCSCNITPHWLPFVIRYLFLPNSQSNQ